MTSVPVILLAGTLRVEKIKEMGNIYVQHYDSPAGELILGSHDGKLCLCDWEENRKRARIDARIQKTFSAEYVFANNALLEKAISELEEYFAGTREDFDIPLIFAGTDFQKKVWTYLLKIPYGKTISYGEMARMLGCPKSVRAVANANGANAISIFAPCHRVIGGNASLTGYAGGLSAKKMLLDIENRSTRNLVAKNHRITRGEYFK